MYAKHPMANINKTLAIIIINTNIFRETINHNTKMIFAIYIIGYCLYLPVNMALLMKCWGR